VNGEVILARPGRYPQTALWQSAPLLQTTLWQTPLLQTTVSTQMPDFPPTTFARSESSSVRRVSADSVSFFAPSITDLLAYSTSPDETSTSHDYTREF
jgi:hypothetical protein